MNEPQYVAQTLAWCNAWRAEQGKKPLARLPKGERAEPASCPCGAATGLYVERFGVYESPEAYRTGPIGNKLAELPPDVREFVRAFDAGRLPQYEATTS